MKCSICNDAPCHRVRFEDVIRSEGELLGAANNAPDAARYRLYRIYITAVHGVLGFRNRRVVPTCVRDFIRELFPDPIGDYVGHLAADSSDNEE